MQDLIIGTIPLLIAFLVSLRFYGDLKSDGLQIFPYFLFTILILQTGGYFYSDIFKKSNHFIFNIYTLVENVFYLYVFHQLIQKRVFKIALYAGALIFFFYYFYDVLYLKQFLIYSPLVSNIGKIVILFCCIFYFFELLIAEEILDFFVIPMFWICTGVMIMVVGDFLYICFFQYILENNIDPDGEVYGVITTLISVIGYTFFTIGFSCKKLWTKTR